MAVKSSPPAKTLTVKTYFYLSGKNKNRRGECPIVCRVATKNDRHDFRTGIFMHPDEWDKKRSLPKNNVREVANRLANVSDRVYALIAECEREGLYSPLEVVRRFKDQKKKPLTLLEIANELLKDEKPGKISCTKILIAAGQFDSATGSAIPAKVSACTVTDVKTKFQQKYTATTVYKKLETLKRIFTYAFRKKYVCYNPFLGYKLPPVPRGVLVQLSTAELEKVRKRRFASQRLRYVRDLFLFQCSTGLSYADIWAVGHGSIIRLHDHSYLKGVRVKSGEEYFLPWLPEAATIARRYNYSFRQITNQKYNSYLKEIAEITGIEKKLTTHVGRKTFAQQMIDRGYSAEAVSKMMGHASFTMTQKHYGRIGEKRIEMEVLRMAS